VSLILEAFSGQPAAYAQALTTDSIGINNK